MHVKLNDKLGTRLNIISLHLLSFLLQSLVACTKNDEELNDYAPLEIISDNLQFAEGPAYNNGNLYFSDIEASRIYMWNEKDGVRIFRENSGRANGLYFDSNGNLIVCESGNKRITSLTSNNNVTVVTDKYGLYPYNEPNDLWISPAGNIYFTDPVFKGTMSQDGQHVYCIMVSSSTVIRVTNDLVKPNGVIGNSEGTKLYVADYGASQIYQYTIMPDGTLSGKQLFVSIKADGLSTDSEGNIYAAAESIMVYNPGGTLIETISVPGTLTNLTIVENENKTAYITTHNAVYRKVIN